MLAGIVLLLQLNGLIVAYKPPEARPNPGNTYLFKVKNRNTKKSVKNVQANNKNTRTTSVTPSGDFIANSEHISHICGKKKSNSKKKRNTKEIPLQKSRSNCFGKCRIEQRWNKFDKTRCTKRLLEKKLNTK